MTSQTSPRIDAHHHVWRYDPREYSWIDESMAVLRRDFLPQDLAGEIGRVGIDGVVTVQARQTLGETRWLLSFAEENDFMFGVVGWVPLAEEGVAESLGEFASHPKLRGVRHVLQDEPDESYMLRPAFNAGVRMLREAGLVYDILIFERHLPQTIEFVDRHPEQLFVLDHIAKPRIRDGLIDPWRANIRELAKRENVYCKLSGMVTEANWHSWDEAGLLPYLDTVLEAFGPARLMFGSDWPVCLVACEYERWFGIVSRYVSKLAAGEQARVLGGTAVEAYRLEVK